MSEIPPNSKLFHFYDQCIRKKNTSNCNSLLEEDDEQNQLKSEKSKQGFGPNLEDDANEKSSKNSRYLHRDPNLDNRRFSSEQKNCRKKGKSKHRSGMRDLNNAEFINEKSLEQSQNSRKAELNFNHNETRSRHDYVRRKNIKDHMGFENFQQRMLQVDEAENTVMRQPVFPQLEIQSYFKTRESIPALNGYNNSNFVDNEISKNRNIINNNCQSLVFDVKTGPILHSVEQRQISEDRSLIHNMASDKEIIKSSFELENQKSVSIGQQLSKEKGKTADKKSPLAQKLSEFKKFPSLVLDMLSTKDKRKKVTDKRPCTMEHIETTNKTENEANSNLYSTIQENSGTQLRHLLNLNTDIFDQTFVHQWLPAQKQIANKQLDIISPVVRPSLKIVESKNVHLDSVRKLEFLSDGSNKVFLATISDDSLVKLWHFKYKEIPSEKNLQKPFAPFTTGQAIQGQKLGVKVDAHPSTKDPFNFSSHAQIRIGSKSSVIDRHISSRKYSSASLNLHQVVRSHQAPLFSCCKSYSENLPYVSAHGPLQLFTGDMKGTISCFRLVDDRLVQWRAFKGGSEPVWALSYAHPGFLLSSTPNKIKLFDLSKLRNKNEEFSISTNKRFFGYLEFLTPESFIVNSFSSKTLKNEFLMFDLMKEKESEKFVSKQGLSNFFKSISKYEMLISANEDRSISFYDVRMKEQVNAFVAHSNAVVSLDVNTDRHLLVTAGCDASIRMWDFRTLRCLTEMPVHRMKYDDSIFDVKFDPSADLFSTAGADSSVKIFQF